MSKFSGADWLENSINASKSGNKKQLSPFARKVADIVGQVYRGLYHLPHVEQHEWGDRYVQVFLHSGHDFSTFDGSELTLMAVLCHDAAIRMAVSIGFSIWKFDRDEDYDEPQFIEFSSTRYVDDLQENEYQNPCLVLSFTQRTHNSDSNFDRHPTLEEAINTARRLGEPIGVVPCQKSETC